MLGFLCFGSFMLVVIVLLISSLAKEKEIEKAKSAYKACLQRLKQDPTNADLRECSLHFGRKYSNLTRDKKGVTIFDEVALMNDINAACAGAVEMTGTSSMNPSQMTFEERLKKLSVLRDQELIDDNEFHDRKQKILNEI